MRPVGCTATQEYCGIAGFAIDGIAVAVTVFGCALPKIGFARRFARTGGVAGCVVTPRERLIRAVITGLVRAQIFITVVSALS